ncbi:hypothetical protein NECID01_0455 [Nematocida sp. AWRm77]|nr:hypothetical protein NECID01_0455 [Nematocida sp. AWRm77]
MRVGPLIVACLGVGRNRVLEIQNAEGSSVEIRFSPHVLPVLSGMPAHALVFTGKESIRIPYRVKILKNYPLGIETGVEVAEVVAQTGESTAKKTVYSRPIIPDFTTLYIAYGLCGATITCIFGVFSKVLLKII